MSEIVKEKHDENYLVVPIVIALLQLAVLIFGSYRAADAEHWDINLYALVFIGIPSFIILGILGIVFAGKGLKEAGRFRSVFMFFMIFSIFFITGVGPMTLSEGMSRFFVPIVKRNYHLEQEREKDNSDNKARPYYNKLSEIFKNPQKVVAVKGSQLLLDNGIAIDLYGADSIKLKDFIYSNNILNQNVTVNMVNFDRFAIQYNQASDGELIFDDNHKKSADFKVFPALVSFQGGLINLSVAAGSMIPVIIKEYPDFSKELMVGDFVYVDKNNQTEEIIIYKGVSEKYNIFTHQIFRKANRTDLYTSYAGVWKSESTVNMGTVYFLDYGSGVVAQYSSVNNGLQCMIPGYANFERGAVFKSI